MIKMLLNKKRYLFISLVLIFLNLYGIYIYILKCRYLFNLGRRNISMVVVKESNL